MSRTTRVPGEGRTSDQEPGPAVTVDPAAGDFSGPRKPAPSSPTAESSVRGVDQSSPEAHPVSRAAVDEALREEAGRQA
ncbi:hypothetical protein [Streptomyces sp. NBC_01708]|uniref:hypothetical protein n=1 Tax=Streptomyces sp. NBC_01708 TaxID=2975915 RepID=UPI002E303257|nr:hypothetical protein [Streptomyces sp. NBC_01708]